MRPTFGRNSDDAVTRRGNPVRSQKTAILLARRIVDEIISNNFGPNSRLPQEKDMIEYFKVGRATLREALRHLEFLGILEIRSGPGGGPVLLKPDGADLGSVLELLLAVSRIRFGEVVDVREVLEPVMAASAASNATDELVGKLRESVKAMGVEELTDDQFLQENGNFHDILAKGSGNRVMEFFHGSLHSIIDGSVVGVHYSQRRRKVVIESHEEITDAIERRDPQAARAAVEALMTSWRAYVSKRHPETLNRPLTWSLHD